LSRGHFVRFPFGVIGVKKVMDVGLWKKVIPNPSMVLIGPKTVRIGQNILFYTFN